MENKRKLNLVLDEQDRFILLKIKRQFSKEEAVTCLLKMVSTLEQEVGILKSEKEELQFTLQQIKNLLIFPKLLESCRKQFISYQKRKKG
jgi:hypothetical protein